MSGRNDCPLSPAFIAFVLARSSVSPMPTLKVALFHRHRLVGGMEVRRESCTRGKRQSDDELFGLRRVAALHGDFRTGGKRHRAPDPT